MTVDLQTRYLGLELRSPIVASASPLNGEPVTAAAPRARRRGGDRPAVAVRGGDPRRGDRAQPVARAGHRGVRRGARLLPGRRRVLGRRRSLPAPRSSGSRRTVGVPVIASLNASERPAAGSATRALIQDAGADALELNLYHVAADPRRTAADMEAADLALIAAVRAAVTHPARGQAQPVLLGLRPLRRGRPSRAGADGLVLFNRFYQPDLDLETLDVVPRLELSQPWELRLPLRWIAILRPQLGPRRLARGDLGRPGRDRRGQGPDGRRRRRDDDLGGAAPRPRATSPRSRPSCGPGWPSTSTSRSASCAAAPARRRPTDPAAFERANYMQTLRSWSAPVS